MSSTAVARRGIYRQRGHRDPGPEAGGRHSLHPVRELTRERDGEILLALLTSIGVNRHQGRRAGRHSEALLNVSISLPVVLVGALYPGGAATSMFSTAVALVPN